MIGECINVMSTTHEKLIIRLIRKFALQYKMQSFSIVSIDFTYLLLSTSKKSEINYRTYG